MNLLEMKVALSRVEEIDRHLPRIATMLAHVSVPGNSRANLSVSCSGNMNILVSHEFAKMLYTAERDLVHERTSLAAALKLDEVTP